MIIADIKLGRKDEPAESGQTPEQIRDAFVANLEQYKKDNPPKYAIKKEALDAELAKLEAACSKKKEPAEEPAEPKVRKPRIKK